MDRPHQADVTLHKCGYTYSAGYTWWALADSNRICFAVCPRSLDYCALRTRIEIAHIGRSFRSGEHATLSRSMSHIFRCAQVCLLSNNDYRSLNKGTVARSDGDQKSERPILTSCLPISQATLSVQVSANTRAPQYYRISTFSKRTSMIKDVHSGSRRWPRVPEVERVQNGLEQTDRIPEAL